MIGYQSLTMVTLSNGEPWLICSAEIKQHRTILKVDKQAMVSKKNHALTNQYWTLPVCLGTAARIVGKIHGTHDKLLHINFET